MTDRFNGDNAKLVNAIEALLELDASGSLVPHGVGGHARTMLEAAAIRLSASKPASPMGWKLVPDDTDADAIVTSLYRRFKDWSKRGFGPDDVTWCEVKADVLAMLAASPAAPTFTPEQMDTLFVALGHFESRGSKKCAASIRSILEMNRGEK